MKRDNILQLSNYLATAKNWLSAEEIAAHLHTSTRTVRNYIREINEIAETKPLIIASSKGYRWNVNQFNLFYRLEHTLPQTPEDRIIYILRNLLYRRSISLSTFLQAMSVSDRTLDTDLIKIKGILKTFHLKLHRCQDMLSLSGKESDQRRLCVYCICQNSNVPPLTLDFLKKGFPEYDVQSIFDSLQTSLKHHHLASNGYSKYDLLLFILIQLERVQKNTVLLERENSICVSSSLERLPDYLAARELCHALEQTCKCHFNDYEIEYMTLIMISKSDYCGCNKYSYITEFDNLQYQLKNCLNILSRHLNLDFSDNQILIKLTHYIGRALVRCSMQLYTSNPLAQSFRYEQPVLQDISTWILLHLSEIYQVSFSRDEICFLSLTLCDYMYNRYSFESKLSCTLICPAYENLLTHISASITNRLGTIMEISHVIDSTDIEEVPSDTDFIISVLPVHNLPNLVLISPIVTSEDCRFIQQEINKIKNTYAIQHLTKYFKQIVNPDFFEIDHSCSIRQDIIHYICEKLKNSNAVDEEFEKIVMQRELADSTAFFNMIALPHACISNVKKNSLYIILNHQSMPWGSERINLLFLLAVKREFLSDFQAIYNLCIKIFSLPKNMQLILQASDLNTFYNCLSLLDPNSPSL